MVWMYLGKGHEYFENHMFNSNPILGSGATRLYGLLNSVQINDSDDVVSWFLTSSSVFSVKSCYNILNDGGHRYLFKKSIWKIAAPLKIKVFA